ncbi:MAG: bifunctional diaminohydroxyphosphoribosylaminopyrimidine deaminase/5-amino-6-(5-phosphoribosylamino)uracil reductase RibD [Planctomycetota bacterium]
MNSADPPSLSDDRYADWMRAAVALAKQGIGLVEPNPTVGCILVDESHLGQALGDVEFRSAKFDLPEALSHHPAVLGLGFHQRFGGPHAEVHALDDCRERGHAPEGATAIVTLEPCCHFGKTPPCANALIQAGVARVVVGAVDPNPQVDSGGIKRLRDAGIDVVVGVASEPCQDLIAPFVKGLQRRQPWVIAKWAMSIDGKIATRTGSSQWITGDLARQDVHRQRGLVDAILCGAGTLRKDDPELTARPPGPRKARRLVMCGDHFPLADRKLLSTIDRAPVTLVLCGNSRNADGESRRDWSRAGAEILTLTSEGSTAQIHELLSLLHEQAVTRMIVEGGGRLLGSFFAADAIDEIHAYIGGKLIGGAKAPGPLGGQGIDTIDQAPSFRCLDLQRLGPDCRLTYRKG